LIATVALRTTSAKLSASVGAPGPHDFAVRFGVARLAPPLRPLHPAPNVRDDRDTPLYSRRDAQINEVCLPPQGSEIFFAKGLDRQANHPGSRESKIKFCGALAFACLLVATAHPKWRQCCVAACIASTGPRTGRTIKLSRQHARVDELHARIGCQPISDALFPRSARRHHAPDFPACALSSHNLSNPGTVIDHWAFD
jgi:hypothetical protein